AASPILFDQSYSSRVHPRSTGECAEGREVHPGVRLRRTYPRSRIFRLSRKFGKTVVQGDNVVFHKIAACELLDVRAPKLESAAFFIGKVVPLIGRDDAAKASASVVENLLDRGNCHA